MEKAYVTDLFLEFEKYVCNSKTEEHGNFVIDNILIKVGGKNKKRKNADFVLRDDIEVPVRNSIPLWLIGFQY
ncbi:MAG: hypothetical protein J7J43_04295 [Thermosipho sp. (in: Bacteria)]|nr:hypothetical protein [Thermosipho sp. (in: thermotogales)]